MQYPQEQQIKASGEILADHQQTLDDAITIVHREEPIVANLRRTIAAMMGESPANDAGLAMGTGLVNDALPNERKVGPDANETHPRRKMEYLELTLIKGAQKALEKLVPPGKFVHVDVIIQEMYEPIPHKDVFYRIKRTVVSELIRGMPKGMFVRGQKPNTFGLPIKVGTSVNANA